MKTVILALLVSACAGREPLLYVDSDETRAVAELINSTAACTVLEIEQDVLSVGVSISDKLITTSATKAGEMKLEVYVLLHEPTLNEIMNILIHDAGVRFGLPRTPDTIMKSGIGVSKDPNQSARELVELLIAHDKMPCQP